MLEPLLADTRKNNLEPGGERLVTRGRTPGALLEQRGRFRDQFSGPPPPPSALGHGGRLKVLRRPEDPMFVGLEEDADALTCASASGSSTPTLKSSRLGVVGVHSSKVSPQRSAPSCGARREREFLAASRKQALHGFGLQVPGCIAPCSQGRAVVAFGNKADLWE